MCLYWCTSLHNATSPSIMIVPDDQHREQIEPRICGERPFRLRIPDTDGFQTDETFRRCRRLQHEIELKRLFHFPIEGKGEAALLTPLGMKKDGKSKKRTIELILQQ